jgi:hypothetical protein
VIGLDSSTGVTLGHVLRYFSLHSRPPEILSQVLVHLVRPWMDRVPGAMSFIHNLATKFKILWNYKAILEPQDSVGVFPETLGFTQLQSSSDVTHSNVILLSSDDIFFDGRNKSYVVQAAMWNDSKTLLFRLTTSKVVAMMFAA